jgi:hypothetical protein
VRRWAGNLWNGLRAIPDTRNADRFLDDLLTKPGRILHDRLDSGQQPHPGLPTLVDVKHDI